MQKGENLVENVIQKLQEKLKGIKNDIKENPLQGLALVGLIILIGTVLGSKMTNARDEINNDAELMKGLTENNTQIVKFTDIEVIGSYYFHDEFVLTNENGEKIIYRYTGDEQAR